jgi:hypothetical protein
MNHLLALKRKRKMAGMILICLFFVWGMNAQKTASDMQLQGNVKRLYTYKHTATDVVVENNKLVSYQKEKQISHIEYIFDKTGNLLAENRFDNTKDLINFSYIYTYDDQNRLIEITLAHLGKFLVGRTEYSYDKAGNKKQALGYNDRDSLKNTVIYQYDSMGNCIMERTFNTIYLVIKELQHQYNERGQCTLSVNLKTLDRTNLPFREIQRFDDSNNLIYKSFFNEHDSLQWEYSARYDKLDSMLYEEVKDGTGTLTNWSALKYNKRHQRILLRQYHYQTGMTRTVYSYDKTGKLIKAEVFVPKIKTPVIIRTYLYDDQGNWIACIEENLPAASWIVSVRRVVYF